jgi:hypothetical protein
VLTLFLAPALLFARVLLLHSFQPPSPSPILSHSVFSHFLCKTVTHSFVSVSSASRFHTLALLYTAWSELRLLNPPSTTTNPTTMRTSTFLSLAGSASFASATIYKGFNYGNTFTDGTIKVQADFEKEFTAAANLVGTSGFTSARLYTMIVCSSLPLQSISYTWASINEYVLTFYLARWFRERHRSHSRRHRHKHISSPRNMGIGWTGWD